MIPYKKVIHKFISNTKYITYNYKDIEIFQSYFYNYSAYSRTNDIQFFGFLIHKYKKQ